ncbi:MAG: efflux RND transporter permease subunit, partial [Methylovulum sp.]|nr:efflux RND transporter permease subunit [Methylovulum sp.]
ADQQEREEGPAVGIGIHETGCGHHDGDERELPGPLRGKFRGIKNVPALTTLSGRFEQMQSAFGRLKIMTPASLFLITLVLFVYFGSIQNTVIILTAALFSVFGGLSFLLLFHESLSVSASVGFISILGVSILNASIFVIHYLQLHQENGIPMEDAITQTASDKFRAIFMTGLTASIGLLPAMLSTGVGSQVQKPLAIVVVGGMLIGTFILLVLMPSLLRFIKIKRY